MELETQYGGKVIPLGWERFKVIEWLYTLSKLRNIDINNKMIGEKLPVILLEMMKLHDMNSLLHCKIYGIFFEVISSKQDGCITAVF